MIKKLCELIWGCIKHPFSSYRYENLWCYLKHGYTIEDYTDLDMYLLKIIGDMSAHLANHQAEIYDLNVLAEELPKEYIETLELSNMATRLYIATIDDVYTETDKQKYRKQFLKQLNKTFFKLWI